MMAARLLIILVGVILLAYGLGGLSPFAVINVPPSAIGGLKIGVVGENSAAGVYVGGHPGTWVRSYNDLAGGLKLDWSKNINIPLEVVRVDINSGEYGDLVDADLLLLAVNPGKTFILNQEARSFLEAYLARGGVLLVEGVEMRVQGLPYTGTIATAKFTMTGSLKYEGLVKAEWLREVANLPELSYISEGRFTHLWAHHNVTDYRDPYSPQPVALPVVAARQAGNGWIIVSATKGWMRLAEYDNYDYTTHYGKNPADPNYRADQKKAIQLYLDLYNAAKTQAPTLTLTPDTQPQGAEIQAPQPPAQEEAGPTGQQPPGQEATATPTSPLSRLLNFWTILGLAAIGTGILAMRRGA